jgi:hypothetical protein
MLNKIAVVVSVLLISSCSPKQVATAPTLKPTNNITVLIEQKLGPGAEVSTNRDKSFSLYKKTVIDTSNNLPVVKYVVIRNDDQRLVEEGSVSMGAIDWSADYELEVSQAQGQAQLERKENSNRRKIDLRPYLARDGRR